MRRCFLTAAFAGIGAVGLLVPLVAAYPWSNQLKSNEVIAQAQVETPLSSDQFVVISSVLGLNICYGVSEGVDYKKAAVASTSAIFAFVRDQHEGKIEGVPSTFQGTPQMTRWIALDLLLRASSICASKLPPEVVSEAKRVRAKLSTAK